MADKPVELPTEVVASIMDQLSLLDSVRATAVCSTWRSAFAETRRGRGVQRDPPWIAFPLVTVEGGRQLCQLCAVFGDDGREVTVDLPAEKQWHRCVGSSDGWLFMLDETCELHMWNPLSGGLVRLPPVATIPGVKPICDPKGRVTHYDVFQFKCSGDDEQAYEYCRREVYSTKKSFSTLFCKAIAFLSPASPSFSGASSYMVVAIYGPLGKLVVARPGDASWRALETAGDGIFDITPHQGRLYAAWPGGIEVANPGDVPPYVHIQLDWPPAGRKYLVESSGRLLLLSRHVEATNGGHYCFRTTEFQVYELDVGGSSWMEAKSLGDQALFVGTDDAISVPVEDSSSQGIKRNCIYFTQDFWGWWYPCDAPANCDVGVFDLGDKSVRSHCCTPPVLGLLSRESPTSWFVSTL